MAKAWITDLWVKDAHALMPDGTKVRIQPTSAELKAVSRLPEHFRTERYGQGKRWRVGWYEPDGHVRTRAFGTRVEAERYKAELVDNLHSGRYSPPELAEQPFSQLAATWLASKRRATESTVSTYEKYLNVHVLPKWAKTPISAITKPMIEEWVGQLAAGTAPRIYSGRAVNRTPVPLAPRTIRLVVSKTFGAAMKYAHDEGWIFRDPLRRVELPRPTPSEALSILSYVEVDRLAETVEEISGNQRDRALVYLLAFGGLRINEALALQVQDIRVADQRADIVRAWTKDRAGRKVIGATKTWERRAIPLHSFVIDELMPLMKGKAPTDWLFRADRGEVALDHKNWYNRVWRPAVSRLGFDDEDFSLTIHKLRHTAASAAIAAGADVVVVQSMLGHQNPTETLNTYTHLWPDRLDEVLAKVAFHRDEALRLAA